MSTLERHAFPRVGLLGNPSDLYRGRVIGFTFRDFRARVKLAPAATTSLQGPGGQELALGSMGELAELDPRACPGGLSLMVAALRRLAVHAPDLVDVERRPLRLEATSDIPRQVGLSGSSAIVVACLRALATHFGVELTDFDCAERALEAETVELGSTAGPQDRVLQSYGGLLFMDFSEPRRHDRYQRLDPALLPPVFVAFDPSPGQDSGGVHADVRARWEAGDPQVRRGVAVFAELAAQGLDDLRRGDHAGFADRVDANLAARRALWSVAPRDLEAAELARGAGAAAKLCGSGGALAVVPRPGADPRAVQAALVDAGWRWLRPTLEV